MLRPGIQFNGVKVFSATMFADRDRLGDKVTTWIAEHAHVQVPRPIANALRIACQRHFGGVENARIAAGLSRE